MGRNSQPCSGGACPTFPSSSPRIVWMPWAGGRCRPACASSANPSAGSESPLRSGVLSPVYESQSAPDRLGHRPEDRSVRLGNSTTEGGGTVTDVPCLSLTSTVAVLLTDAPAHRGRRRTHVRRVPDGLIRAATRRNLRQAGEGPGRDRGRTRRPRDCGG